MLLESRVPLVNEPISLEWNVQRIVADIDQSNLVSSRYGLVEVFSSILNWEQGENLDRTSQDPELSGNNQ